jgi:ABC-2 type transport system permease protein
MENNMRLYKLTLKKLLIPACIMGIMSIVANVLYLSGKIKQVAYSRIGFGSFFRGQPTAVAIAPSLVLLMFLGSVVFSYLAFSHLNKRNASDFYHSLPYTRKLSFWSRLGAVLTYQISIIVITLLASTLTMVLLKVSFNASFIPLLFLGYTACSLLVIGATILAMSITGTFLSNALVAGLILFLPRMILFIVDQFIMIVTFRRVLIGHTGILLNPVYNIATASLLDLSRLWEYYGLSETLINKGSIIYTFILAIVYIALAAILMKRRKSEMAGRGAINSKVACVFSSFASLPFLVLAIYTTNGRDMLKLNYTSYMNLLVMVAVGFAAFLIVGFMLNLKWKPILKSIPLFAVALGVAVGIFFGAIAMAKDMAVALPDRDKIEYVTINESNEKEYRYKPVYEYSSLLVSDIEFRDDDIIDLFYDVLKSNNAVWLEQSNDNYERLSIDSRVICEFKLKNGKRLYRYLHIYTKDIEAIYNVLIKNDQYINAHTSLPDDGQIYAHDKDQDKALYSKTWQAYIAEFNNMTYIEKLYAKSGYGGQSILTYATRRRNHFDIIASFRVQGYVGSTPYSTHAMIGQTMPNTADFFMKQKNMRVEDTFIADLENVLSEKSDNKSHINITIFGDSTQYQNLIYSDDIPKEELEFFREAMSETEYLQVVEIISAQDFSKISITQPFLIVNIDSYGEYEQQNDHNVAYVPLSEKATQQIADLYESKMNNSFEVAQEKEIMESEQ